MHVMMRLDCVVQTVDDGVKAQQQILDVIGWKGGEACVDVRIERESFILFYFSWHKFKKINCKNETKVHRIFTLASSNFCILTPHPRELELIIFVIYNY